MPSALSSRWRRRTWGGAWTHHTVSYRLPWLPLHFPPHVTNARLAWMHHFLIQQTNKQTSTTTQTYNYNVVHPQLLGIWYELLLPDSFVHVSLLMWDVTYDPLSSVRQAKPRVTSDSVIFAQLFCVVDSFCKQKFFFKKKSCCTKRWKGS